MLLNRLDFTVTLLITFFICSESGANSLHHSLLRLNLEDSSQHTIFHYNNDVLNYSWAEGTMQFEELDSELKGVPQYLINLYKKLRAALYIEKFDFIKWYNKNEQNLEEFQEAISFVVTPSMLNNYDCFKLKDFLSKFINFVRTFDDFFTKLRLASYFINSEPLITKFISKDSAFLAYYSFCETLLFKEKILGNETLRKLFLENNKSKQLSPEESTKFLLEAYSVFTKNRISGCEKPSKRMTMAFVPIIQQSQDEGFIKIIESVKSKYPFSSILPGIFRIEHSNTGRFLFSIKYLKEKTYSDIFKKIQSSLQLNQHISNYLFHDLKGWGGTLPDYLKEILLISDFIKDESDSANEKEKSFGFLSNVTYFKPFYYTEFSKIMNALLIKIENENSKFNFIKENNKNDPDAEVSIAAFKIEKLISYFSSVSLEFYILHFIEFLIHEMKISKPIIIALTRTFFFNSAVICYTGKEVLHYSHLFGKQFFNKDLDTPEAPLKIRSVDKFEINRENFTRKYHYGFFDKITLEFQDSQLSYKPIEASEIILEKDICHVFKIKDSFTSLRKFETILYALLSSLPDANKNDLVIELMMQCAFYFEFHEKFAWQLFWDLKNKLTCKLPEHLVFFESICLFIVRNNYFDDRYFKFKKFYAFLFKKDLLAADRGLAFIFENSKDSEEIFFLLEVFIPVFKFELIEKNVVLISKIYNLFKEKDQNSALKFIKKILSSPKEYCGGFYIENENLSKLIDKIVSDFNYDKNPDFFTLISMLELANKEYSSKLKFTSIYFLKQGLQNSNIDEADKSKLLERIETVNKQK